MLNIFILQLPKIQRVQLDQSSLLVQGEVLKALITILATNLLSTNHLSILQTLRTLPKIGKRPLEKVLQRIRRRVDTSEETQNLEDRTVGKIRGRTRNPVLLVGQKSPRPQWRRCETFVKFGKDVS